MYKFSLTLLTTYINFDSHLESLLFWTYLKKYPFSTIILERTVNILAEIFIPLYFIVQTNKLFVLLLIKNSKYPVQFTTFGLVPSPYLWNLQLDKWVYLEEKLLWVLFWVVVYFLPTLEQTISEPYFPEGVLFSFYYYRPWLPISKFEAFFCSHSKGRDLHNCSRLHYFLEA